MQSMVSLRGCCFCQVEFQFELGGGVCSFCYLINIVCFSVLFSMFYFRVCNSVISFHLFVLTGPLSSFYWDGVDCILFSLSLCLVLSISFPVYLIIYCSACKGTFEYFNSINIRLLCYLLHPLVFMCLGKFTECMFN